MRISKIHIMISSSKKKNTNFKTQVKVNHTTKKSTTQDKELSKLLTQEAIIRKATYLYLSNFAEGKSES